MPRYAIRPESLMPPTSFSPYLSVSFRMPYESRDPIYPASGLQLSFERSDTHHEIFVDRVSASDIHQDSSSGLCTVRLRRDEVPKYPLRAGDDAGHGAADVLVKLHAWKGDRHLGVWEVGKLNGRSVYRAAAE